MYDWSLKVDLNRNLKLFQLLLKGCTIEAQNGRIVDITLGHVSVVVERMYDWSNKPLSSKLTIFMFQLLLKGCTIEAGMPGRNQCLNRCVSVVVERMYDWSSETNWLKTNDFWQLVSDLFFENGRSAQKVPLFSKIWGDLGDCLTVFDSCSNI